MAAFECYCTMVKIQKLTGTRFATISRYQHLLMKFWKNQLTLESNQYGTLDMIGRETIIRVPVQVCFVFQNEL